MAKDDDAGRDASIASITRFLRGILVTGKKIVRIELTHKGGSGNNRVRTWTDFTAEKGLDPTKLAEEIHRDAMDDAEAFKGYTQYYVLAWCEGESEPSDRTWIKVGAKESYSKGSIDETEPPTKKGMISQIMRHKEVMTKMMLQTFVDMQRQYQRMNDAQADRIERMEKDQVNVLDLLHSLITRDHERKIEMQKIERQEKKDEFIQTKLGTLFPVVMGKLMGAAGISGGEAEKVLGEEGIMQLLGTLQPNQIEAFMGALNQEQAALFYQVYTMYANKAKEKANVPPATP